MLIAPLICSSANLNLSRTSTNVTSTPVSINCFTSSGVIRGTLGLAIFDGVVGVGVRAGGVGVGVGSAAGVGGGVAAGAQDMAAKSTEADTSKTPRYLITFFIGSTCGDDVMRKCCPILSLLAGVRPSLAGA